MCNIHSKDKQERECCVCRICFLVSLTVSVLLIVGGFLMPPKGEISGSVYDYGDGTFTINMDDIIYCVLADVTYEQYIEWQEYICDAAEFGFDTPNLRSFVRGCPRTSAETFKHLREIKAMLNDAIQDEKERVKNEL